MDAHATVLAHFGLTEADRLGGGNQTQVFALDETTIIRPYPSHLPLAFLKRQRDFYNSLDTSTVSFKTPMILELGVVDGVPYTLEPLLQGRDLQSALEGLADKQRQNALKSYLNTARKIRTLVEGKVPFGEVLVSSPIQADEWTSYLERRIDATLLETGNEIGRDVPGLETAVQRWRSLLPLVADAKPELVHGDYFPGNVMVDEAGAVTAVIDFSASTVMGDWRLDVVTACIFLELTANVTRDDIAFCKSEVEKLLGSEATPLAQLYRLYYALYYTFTRDSDPPLYRWCVSVLNLSS